MSKLLSKKQQSLDSARDLFVNPPTDIVEQAEAAKYLKDTLSLTRPEIALTLGITDRQVKTRLVEWKNYVLKGQIPTGMLPLGNAIPMEEVIFDVESKALETKLNKESTLIAKEDIFLTKLTTAIAPYLPTKHDLTAVEKLYREAFSGPRTHKEEEEEAVATMSDLHLYLTEKDHTVATGLQANDNFMKKVLRLTELQRSHCRVDTINLNVIGDMTQGTANFSNQRWTVDRPACDQAEGFTEVLVKDINLLLVNYGKVKVNVRNGNHGYIVPGKTSPDPAHSNWDTVIGRSIKWAFKDHPRVEINLSEDWYTIVEVMGTKILLTHGHDISGGGNFDQLIRTVNKWQAILPEFSICIMGHFHRIACLPLPREHGSTKPRTLYTNGTAVISDSFLQRMGGSPTSQWWLMFFGKRGLTNEYRVDLY